MPVRFIGSLLAAVLVTWLSVGVGVAPVTHSAPAPTGPAATSVLVAIDATSTSRCQVTYHLNVGWHSTPPRGAKPLVPWTKTLPCAAGTIIKTAVVPLSQAMAQHERYAPLPANPKVPTTAERAAIRALTDAKRASFTSAQATQAAAIPASGCGADSYAYRQWSEQGVGFYSQVW